MRRSKRQGRAKPARSLRTASSTIGRGARFAADSVSKVIERVVAGPPSPAVPEDPAIPEFQDLFELPGFSVYPDNPGSPEFPEFPGSPKFPEEFTGFPVDLNIPELTYVSKVPGATDVIEVTEIVDFQAAQKFSAAVPATVPAVVPTTVPAAVPVVVPITAPVRPLRIISTFPDKWCAVITTNSIPFPSRRSLLISIDNEHSYNACRNEGYETLWVCCRKTSSPSLGFSSRYGVTYEILNGGQEKKHMINGNYEIDVIDMYRFLVKSTNLTRKYNGAVLPGAQVIRIKDERVLPAKFEELKIVFNRIRELCTRLQKLKEFAQHDWDMPPLAINWTKLGPDGPSWHWWIADRLIFQNHQREEFLSMTCFESRLNHVYRIVEYEYLRYERMYPHFMRNSPI